MNTTTLINKVRELIKSAPTQIGVVRPLERQLAVATLVSGMLINEGLHRLADSIDGLGDIELSADKIASAIALLETS